MARVSLRPAKMKECRQKESSIHGSLDEGSAAGKALKTMRQDSAYILCVCMHINSFSLRILNCLLKFFKFIFNIGFQFAKEMLYHGTEMLLL